MPVRRSAGLRSRQQVCPADQSFQYVFGHYTAGDRGSIAEAGVRELGCINAKQAYFGSCNSKRVPVNDFSCPLNHLGADDRMSVIVTEKEPSIYPLPRAAYIDHEGMRILQEAGAAEAVMATSRQADRYEFRNARGRLLLSFDGAGQLGHGGWPVANMMVLSV